MSSRKAAPKSGKPGNPARGQDDKLPPGGDCKEGDSDTGSESGPEEPRTDPESSVADYLRTHPDFFDDNPEVLAALSVPHQTGGAVSLIEHQVGVLRRQLQTERGRLSQLISRARDYESASNRLHAVVLKLIPARDIESLGATLTEALSRELGADAVTLKLFSLVPGTQDDPLSLAFRDFLDREHALCGPLEEDKQRILFGDTEIRIQSAALIPVRADGSSGVLAIGATDAQRFRPEMGTDILDRLGEIVSAKLHALLPAKTRARRAGSSKPRAAAKSTAKPRAKSPPKADGTSGPSE